MRESRSRSKIKLYASAKLSLTHYGHFFDFISGPLHTRYDEKSSISPVVCDFKSAEEKKDVEDTSCSNLDIFSRTFAPYFDTNREEDVVSDQQRILNIKASRKYITISSLD